jgi:hypothetical protein
MIACAKQFLLALTFTILVFRWAILESGLPLHLIPLPNPTGILTECTSITNLSIALILAFDCDTLSNNLHITSPDI